MNFKQLEAFYWLTQLQSFHLVASHLGLTQPAVSTRIALLEDEYGIKLIDRSAPKFRLTEQGHEVADFAARFMNMQEAMLERLAQGRRRRFTIGMVGPAALTWGGALRAALNARADGLVAEFRVGSNLQLQREVSSGALDLAFLTDETGHADSFTVRYHVGWVARPDVGGTGAERLTPDDLRALPLILYPRTSPLHAPIADYIEETRHRDAARHFGNSFSTLVDMVRHGYGASALPLAVLEQDLATRTLVELPVTAQLPPMDVRCVHMTGARKQQAADVHALASDVARDWCAAHPRYSTFLEPGQSEPAGARPAPQNPAS